MWKRLAPGLVAGPALVTLALVTPAARATTYPLVAGAPAHSAPTEPPISSALTTAYASFRHIRAADVNGIRRGSVRTAYDPATKTHWATASFFPSPADSQAVLLGFQPLGMRDGAAPTGAQRRQRVDDSSGSQPERRRR
jgi:hypothetical protein